MLNIGIYFILAVFLLAPSVHLLGRYFTKHFDDNLKHFYCAWCGKMAEYVNPCFVFFFLKISVINKIKYIDIKLILIFPSKLWGIASCADLYHLVADKNMH